MKKVLFASAVLVSSFLVSACGRDARVVLEVERTPGPKGGPRIEVVRDDLAVYPEVVRLQVDKLLTEAKRLEKLDDLEFHQTAYRWASSGSGLDFTTSDAKKFADNLLPLTARERAKRLVIYQEAYRYAVSSSGLDLTMSQARDFAANAVSTTRPFDFVARHRLIYQYAVSGDGLDLTMSNARTLANRIALDLTCYETLAAHKKWYRYAVSGDGLNMTMSQARAYADAKAGWAPTK